VLLAATFFLTDVFFWQSFLELLQVLVLALSLAAQF
jgi:hypothetical protein